MVVHEQVSNVEQESKHDNNDTLREAECKSGAVSSLSRLSNWFGQETLNLLNDNILATKADNRSIVSDGVSGKEIKRFIILFGILLTSHPDVHFDFTGNHNQRGEPEYNKRHLPREVETDDYTSKSA